MFARTISRLVVLALLLLQTLASVAEAAECGPHLPASAYAGSSCSERAVAMSEFPESRHESCPPASPDQGDHRCEFCPFCLAPFIEASPLSVSPDDRIQRFAPAEYAMLYEAPSFTLLRPPIV
ncbi:MAG TPA: hypothetical protein VJ161_05430 [Geobacteraceae bacterium]|nr:hypothetical protein [Geobacteraceae bacterium]